MNIMDRLDEIEDRADNAINNINACMGDTIYVCYRDWSAWGYGTMGLDDFGLACNDPDVAESLANETANGFVPELIATLKRVAALLAEYEADDREHLNTFGQHHPYAGWAAGHLREALTGET